MRFDCLCMFTPHTHTLPATPTPPSDNFCLTLLLSDTMPRNLSQHVLRQIARLSDYGNSQRQNVTMMHVTHGVSVNSVFLMQFCVCPTQCTTTYCTRNYCLSWTVRCRVDGLVCLKSRRESHGAFLFIRHMMKTINIAHSRHVAVYIRWKDSTFPIYHSNASSSFHIKNTSTETQHDFINHRCSVLVFTPNVTAVYQYRFYYCIKEFKHYLWGNWSNVSQPV